jgi:hypothetical protein
LEIELVGGREKSFEVFLRGKISENVRIHGGIARKVSLTVIYQGE